jgi:hypothetical protein
MTCALLRLASWIVPPGDRDAWLAEWRAELWAVEHAGARPLAFCLGAFHDALWLRRHDERPRPALLASPARCLAALAALAALCFVLRPSVQLPNDVVALRPHGRKTLTTDEYRALIAHPPSQFVAIAFYRRTPDGAVLATRPIQEILRGATLPGEGRYVVVDDPGPGSGHIIARLATVQRAPWRHVVIYTETRGREYLDCIPVVPGSPAGETLLAFGLAILVFPAGVRFTMAAYGAPRAWLFFAAKLGFVLAAAYCAVQMIGPHLRVQGGLIGVLLAIHWVLRDQQRRCPVCLSRLASPVSFGCLSHTLLEWHGSEFICPRGHGLLQVSATFASPYAPQHWLPL